MVTKLAWLTRKRGVLLVLSVLVAALGAKGGHGHYGGLGFFDGG